MDKGGASVIDRTHLIDAASEQLQAAVARMGRYDFVKILARLVPMEHVHDFGADKDAAKSTAGFLAVHEQMRQIVWIDAGRPDIVACRNSFAGPLSQPVEKDILEFRFPDFV